MDRVACDVAPPRIVSAKGMDGCVEAGLFEGRLNARVVWIGVG